MKLKSTKSIAWGCVIALGLFSKEAKAADYVMGMDFVVSHNTTISGLGVFDGGTALSADETVGVFDDSTGNLVGSELVFGPGYSGAQVGNTLYETLTPFTLAAGEYSIVSIGGSPTAGSTGSSGNSLDLGNTLELPGGSRFGSGVADAVITQGGESTSTSALPLVDPPSVPDGGLTVVLLGGVLAGIGWMRRSKA
jgi:hypothetical protein